LKVAFSPPTKVASESGHGGPRATHAAS